MTKERFIRITKGRSYTVMPYKEGVKDTLRISKDKMIVFIIQKIS